MQIYRQRCVTCKGQFDQKDYLYTCPKCGDLQGTLEIIYDYEQIRNTLTKNKLKVSRNHTIFRYIPLLPCTHSEFYPNLQVGHTPLYQFNDIARRFKVKAFYVKDESFNPSLSLKDRASAVSVVKAKQFGFDIISTASTGNAAASLACLAAHMNLRSVIFVPRSIPRPKLIQLQIFGARIILVNGTYDQAFDLCRRISASRNWFNRSTAINPYNLEGKKTAAFEICEQMNFSVPDFMFIPVGDGCILSAMWKGFDEFYRIGLIDRVPRLIGCQAEGSAAIYHAFRKNQRIPEPVRARTIADSISVDLPRDGVKALAALRKSGGDAVCVSDREILMAQQKLAQQKGIFCEPSAAAAFAGFLKYNKEKNLNDDSSVLVLLTGSGMKDLAATEKLDRSKQLFYLDYGKDDPEEKLKDIF